ncbi:C4-dicarboxylate TRAP transporter substrate-binding protein [Pseudooceanicola sp. 200-1SW]|uniref:C4-dicarboxylate TRAP transporter substrate-binding protein n=1 Tax=Pseudooceanicola sp. 200-1SW TaxID=3425949 RepID=UPI003D7FBDAA
MKTIMTGAAVAALCLGATGAAQADEWSVSLWGKPRAFTAHVEKLAEVLDETTNGEFTLNISYGGLSKNTENLDGISIGAFEMAQFCAGYHRDKNPSITVLELPFLGVNTLEEEIAASMAVYNHPAVKEDLGRWNAMLLMPSPLPQYNLVGTGAPRTTLEDFEGMRVRATGGIGEAFRTVGAVPTSVTSSEAYAALDSGTVDTVSFAPHAHLSFRTIDMADWWTTNLNPGTVNCPVVVNTDAYDMLSDEHRAALDAAIPVVMEHYLAEYGKIYEKWDQVLAERGVEKVTFSEEDLAAFRAKAADPIREQWIADMTAQGLPGQELYDTMMAALKEAQM